MYLPLGYIENGAIDVRFRLNQRIGINALALMHWPMRSQKRPVLAPVCSLIDLRRM